MDTCLRSCVTKYDISNFPYEITLPLWQSNCGRSEENNIANFSNQIDTYHNVLEAHNDSSLVKIMFTM